jgi:salicylate hydroxylase
VHITTNGKETTLEAANIIAADGINSQLRTQVVKDKKNYLGVVGVYGCIPNAKAQEHLQHEFQVDDFKGWRLFSKPYNIETYNWQFFFPWAENQPLPTNAEMLKYIVKELTERGWKQNYIDHVKDTDPQTMRSGLLYDRDPLSPLTDAGPITFMGDAAHPVSPYKGRGANLAIEGMHRFVDIAKKALQEEADVNWSKINRDYETQHWPNAAQIQLSCRESVWDHHFFPSTSS